MKNQLKFRFIFLVILSVLSLTSFQDVYAQKIKKSKVRLKAQYVKIMEGDIYIDISATSRVKKKNIKVSNIILSVYNDLEEEKIILGKITTNKKGKTRFILKDLRADEEGVYNISISFKGNKAFKKAKKRISFKNASIEAKLITIDSVNYIAATLIDLITNSPITDVSLDVQVQRLFRPLKIGEEFNNTDKNGSILVAIEDDIPGVDGKLTIEVVLNDSDEYGTVKALVNAPIGIPIVDESTFDDRTMWSPRNKTPIFLLIFPNLLIIGVWGLIIYLISNLFKISKS